MEDEDGGWALSIPKQASIYVDAFVEAARVRVFVSRLEIDSVVARSDVLPSMASQPRSLGKGLDQASASTASMARVGCISDPFSAHLHIK